MKYLFRKKYKNGRKAAVLPVSVLLIGALLLGGCGLNRELTDPYQVYSSDFTTSTGNQKFFADSLCVSADLNVGTDRVTSETAGAAGAFNLTSQEVVYSQNIFDKMYPASTTKILTAYIILRYANLDDMVTVSHEASHPDTSSSVCGINEGDYISVRDLLYGMMLESGNDAAIALAEYYSGSVSSFCEVMNEEAANLGATHSHFMNSCGLPDDNHYTTVYDMYLIFAAAVSMDKFTEIAGCSTYTASYTNASGSSVTKEWNNTCRYFGHVSLPDGFTLLSAKTGTTNAAGNCLVLYTENSSGEKIISIVYKADTRYDLYTLMNQILTTFAK